MAARRTWPFANSLILEMLTISDCKKILSQVQEDEQVKEIRDTLYQLANLLIENYLKDKNKFNNQS